MIRWSEKKRKVRPCVIYFWVVIFARLIRFNEYSTLYLYYTAQSTLYCPQHTVFRISISNKNINQFVFIFMHNIYSISSTAWLC